jgi:hypothetical protein
MLSIVATCFSYSGKETRFVTKVLQKAGLHITFTTRQTIGKLLTCKPDQPSDKYDESVVYQLTCFDYHKHYISQIDSTFRTWFKEHAQDYRHGSCRSNFAKHLPEFQHTLHPMEDSMSALHISNKGRMLNTLESFHDYEPKPDKSSLYCHAERHFLCNPIEPREHNQIQPVPHQLKTGQHLLPPRNPQSTPVYHHRQRSARYTPSRKEFKKNRWNNLVASNKY